MDDSALSVNLTGFGSFQGVADNPTTTLMSAIEAYITERNRDAGYDLAPPLVLRTAAHDAVEAIRCAIAQRSHPSRRLVWVMVPNSNPTHELNYSTRMIDPFWRGQPVQSFQT